MINALTVRVQAALAAAGHYGHCSIEYPVAHVANATITFAPVEGEPVSETMNLAGKTLPELTVLVCNALLPKLGAT